MTLQIFKCGCDLNGHRCFEHLRWACHEFDPLERRIYADRECPPCFVERLRSIQLGAGTTPTRTTR